MKIRAVVFGTCVLAAVLCSCATENRCTLNINQAPELRKLTLGMHADEVQRRYPGAGSPKEFGFGQSFLSIKVSKFPELSDVDRLDLAFVDSRIVTITAFYTKQLEWTSDELSKRTAVAMGLDGPWKETLGGFLSMYCGKGFDDALLINVGVRKPNDSSESLPYIELENLKGSREPLDRQENSNAEANRKRNEQKNAFRP